MTKQSLALGLLVVAAATALSTTAAAADDEEDGGPSASVVNKTIGAWRVDNGDGIDEVNDHGGLLVNRLQLDAGQGMISASARIDAALFSSLPPPLFPNDARIERLSASARWHGFTLTLGDDYVELGQGLVLSLRQRDQWGLDTALRGVHAGYRSGPHDVSVFAGITNAGNVDPINFAHVDDPNDVAVGGEYKLTPQKMLTVSLLGLYLRPQLRANPSIQDQGITGGATVEVRQMLGVVNAFLEVDAQERWVADVPQHGTAAYASSDVTLGRVTLTGEALLAHDFEQRGSLNKAIPGRLPRFAYNRVPSLERMGMDVATTPDIAATRLRTDVEVSEIGMGIFLVGMARDNEWQGENPFVQGHVFAGVEEDLFDKRTHWSVTAGARDEKEGLGARKPVVDVKSLIHADADFTQALIYGVEVDLATTAEWWMTPAYPFLRGSTWLTFEKSQWGSLGVELGYDQENRLPSASQLYLAGTASVELGDVLEGRAVVGTQRDGMRCVAGSCRYVPAFSGARLEVIARY